MSDNRGVITGVSLIILNAESQSFNVVVLARERYIAFECAGMFTITRLILDRILLESTVGSIIILLKRYTMANAKS